MKRHARYELIVALVVPVTFAACGGKAASPGGGGTASHVTLEAEDQKKYEVAGPAFAQVDAATKRLVVYAYRDGTQPTPSCDRVAAVNTLQKGGFVWLEVAGFTGAPGTYAVVHGWSYFIDPDKGDRTSLGTLFATTSIAVRASDGKIVTGDITATGAAPKATGAVVATICPGAPMNNGASAQVSTDAIPPPEPMEEPQPPPVVARVDTEGVAGFALGMSAKKLPKGAVKRKAASPKEQTTAYTIATMTSDGESFKDTIAVFAKDHLLRAEGTTEHCEGLQSKLKERYGEGGHSGGPGERMWHGAKSELRVVPLLDGSCIFSLEVIQPPAPPGSL